MRLKKAFNKINKSFITHKGRPVTVDQMYSHSYCGEFLRISTAVSQTVNCELCYILSLWMDGTFSCVAMLEPLLTQALADTENECQPNPDPGVAYMESAWKPSDHISYFTFFMPLFAELIHVCTYQVKSPPAHSGVQEPLVCLCVYIGVYLYMCHVSGIAVPFHMSPCHQLRFPAVAWVGESRCHVWGSIKALAGLCATSGLQLSVCDEPGAGANISLLWHGSGCQQKAWHGIKQSLESVQSGQNAKWAFDVTDMRSTSSLVLLRVSTQAQMEGLDFKRYN